MTPPLALRLAVKEVEGLTSCRTQQQQPYYFEEDVGQEELRESISEVHKSEKEVRDKRAYVLCFGKNSNGELGVHSTKDVLMPRHIVGAMFKSAVGAAWISSGSHHTGIVTSNGELFMCGSALHGKLGISNLKLMQITKFQPIVEP